MKAFVTILLLDKKTQQSRKVVPAWPGPRQLLVLNKNLILMSREEREETESWPGGLGALGALGWHWDWSRVIKLIMPGCGALVLWCCGETTQAEETPA